MQVLDAAKVGGAATPRHLPHDAAVHPMRRPKLVLAAADATTVLVVALLAAISVPTEVAGGSAAATVAGVLGAPVVWIIAFLRERLYTARCIGRRLEEFRRIVRASSVAAGVMAASMFIADAPFRRAWLLLLFVGTTAAVTVEREAARRVFLRLRKAGKLRRRVIVVGANHEASELAESISNDPLTGYEVVGFVTDEHPEHVDAGCRDRLLGSVDETVALALTTQVSGVLIASTAVTTTASNRLARRLTDTGVHVELSSTLRDVAPERLRISTIGRFPVVYVEAVHRNGWRVVAKRAFDVVVSLFLLLALAPMLLVIAVAVRLTSRGPVLFRQVRVGHDGVPFELLKFRTMVVDAETRLAELIASNEADGPLFKMAEDPRVTSVGRLLRRSSVDELPQLWNVVRGEMSLVGPRPALPVEAQQWTPELRERLRVKPGITGMWQVNGRSTATFDDYVRLDLFYVDNWSLITDVAILARTIPVVLLQRGAH